MLPHRQRQPRTNRAEKAEKAAKAEKAGEAEAEGSVCSSNSSRNAKGAKETPMILMAAPPAKKPKHQSPQDAIDEFWAKFDSKTPGRATTILPTNKFTKEAGKKSPKGVVEGENAVSSYEEAAKICKEKVEKIVKECRRVNQKYVDNHFNIEFDLKWGKKDCLMMLSDSSENANSYFDPLPGSVKRVGDIFDNPKFFVEGATANDIRQGRDGDCWFMAALCTLGNKPGLIEKVCVARDEQVGVYGFVFYRDGEWISEIIDDKLYLIKPDYDESWEERNMIEDRQRIDSEEDYRKIYQTNSGALYFAQCEDPNETWLPLMEKAYAKAHGDYAAIEGGWTGEGLEDLTGGVTTELLSTDILDKEYFWNEELMKVNKDFLFGCSSSLFWGRGYRKGIYEGHAYSIMKCVEIDKKRLCLLRNPWGEGEWTGAWSDGSKEWTPEWMQKLEHRFGDDGAFWMSYEDLLKKYQTFDRTRLFTDEWKVTQQWTSVTVPWSVDYNSTKFSFTLEKKAPVVIVLSQLDSRYFCGLEGQYSFDLTFRVHKAGEEDYIVRSHGNYSMSRSATAELELDAGEYHVLMKVEANRNGYAAQVEDVVRNNAKLRRDKLLRIGLSYDLAHAKGKFHETDEEKKARKKFESAKKAKEKKEMKDKLMKEKKQRKHTENREKRKQQAAKIKRREKRKAKAKKAEKEKLEKEKLAKGEEAKKAEAKEVPTEGEAKPTESAEKDSKSDEKTMTTALPEASETKPTKISSETPKPSDPPASKSASSGPPPPPGPPGSRGPPPLGSSGPFDDSDDDSDINSVISDISSTAVEDAIEEAGTDPWNAIAVIGLRIYSKDSGVSVKVIRPREWELDGERKLDVDDSAADATKKTDEQVKEGEEKEGEGKKTDEKAKTDEKIDEKVSEEAKPDAIEKKEEKSETVSEEKVESNKKEEEGSEGSGVIV
ncbi:hypothetical protein G7Y89_g2614 [Cudoniella acicularis]|uniref:Calpain catalytic domain-containing protein n=1 Tax=Cudoniella acicularis TaxID=354080 RepID=A0A8H4W6S7_9HELO|nr:hypothetical protein G7Y89_g2614 [Cudoniella acicularis]